MKNKKIPMRKCVACEENKAKNDLIRIVNNKEEGVSIDPTGKKNGRGAYICIDSSCVELAKKNRRLEHALKTEITENMYEEINDYVKNVNAK